jgi:hypothetical protein
MPYYFGMPRIPCVGLSVHRAALYGASDLGGEPSWLQGAVEEWRFGSVIWLMDAAVLGLKKTKLFGKRMAEKQ